ncbi:hypothetical protein GGQ19_002802 [Salinibacter ruber]|nr:hypothetical protein [Salinibacter ruber]MCS3751607.1 hypothetical protein [Salinibacter ruber]
MSRLFAFGVGGKLLNAWTKPQRFVRKKQFSVSKCRAVEEAPGAWPSLQRTPQ